MMFENLYYHASVYVKAIKWYLGENEYHARKTFIRLYTTHNHRYLEKIAFSYIYYKQNPR